MKPHSPELLTLFRGRQFFQVDLYRITLAEGGAILRYCSGDADVTGDGELFSAGGQVGPYFDRTDQKSKCSWRVGTETDSLTFAVIPYNALVGGAAFLDACQLGIFDGATVELLQANMPTYNDTRVGLVRKFKGIVSNPNPISQSGVTFNVSSMKTRLNQQLPRHLYQSSCVNNLGDNACGVNLAGFRETTTAGGGSTASTVVATNVVGAAPAGLYNLGTIEFLSGVLTGTIRTIRTCGSGAGASITLLNPLPSAPIAGVSFRLTQGCDHSLAGVNGCPKFANTARYRGQNYIPQPVTAI